MSDLLDQIATPVKAPRGYLRAWLGTRSKTVTDAATMQPAQFPACAKEYAPKRWQLGWGLGGFTKHTDNENEVAEWLGL